MAALYCLGFFLLFLFFNLQSYINLWINGYGHCITAVWLRASLQNRHPKPAANSKQIISSVAESRSSNQLLKEACSAVFVLNATADADYMNGMLPVVG